jgi:hypothetical protein
MESIPVWSNAHLLYFPLDRTLNSGSGECDNLGFVYTGVFVAENAWDCLCLDPVSIDLICWCFIQGAKVNVYIGAGGISAFRGWLSV